MIVNARTRNMYDSKNYLFITQPQYLIDEVKASNHNFTLIDAGAYTGDTIESFIGLVGENYGEIFCFEPDTKNLDLLYPFISNNRIDKVKIIEYGLHSSTQTLNFSAGNSSSSK